MKKLLISLFLLSNLFIGGKTIILHAEETSNIENISLNEETSAGEISSNEIETSEEISSIGEKESETASEITSETNPILDNKDKIEEKLNEWFSPAVVANIMSWLAYIGTIIGLVNNLKKAKKENNLTLSDVKEQVCGELEKVVSKEVTEKVAKYFDGADRLQNEIKDVLETFAKIMALSQENTPESRIAILDLIQKLGGNTNKMIEEIKTAVNEQVEKQEAKKEENVKELDKIIDDGTNI